MIYCNVDELQQGSEKESDGRVRGYSVVEGGGGDQNDCGVFDFHSPNCANVRAY